MQVSYIGNTLAFQAGKVGSIPTTCSIKQKTLRWLRSSGMSPSGKAMDFDSITRRFESCHPSHFNMVH